MFYVERNMEKDATQKVKERVKYTARRRDAQVALYYAQHEGAYVFNDFDIYVEGMDFMYDNYLITTLKKALAVLELQDEMFDNMTN